MREIGAGGGEFGGESREVGAGSGEFGRAGGFTPAKKEPHEGSRERGGGEGDDGKNHVKIVGSALLQINPGCVP